MHIPIKFQFAFSFILHICWVFTFCYMCKYFEIKTICIIPINIYMHYYTNMDIDIQSKGFAEIFDLYVYTISGCVLFNSIQWSYVYMVYLYMGHLVLQFHFLCMGFVNAFQYV